MVKKLLFVAILAVAVILRFALLSTVPPSASLDEATIGWNAYSLLHTGKDEYGYFLPILLRAYDDYRPALYVYLVVPSIWVFGLTVWAVRLPSVVMSMVTVILTFFLTKNFLPTFKKKETVALLAMFLLAISPWHVYISRLGHEVNLGLTLIVVSTLLFFLAINKQNKWLLVASLISFGISFYSYQSEKVFTPLLLVGLFIIFSQQLLAMKKYAFVGLILFALVSLPIFLASLTPGALLRLKGTSIFTDNPAYTISAEHILKAKQKGDKLGEILNNRRIITIEIFAQNYFSHFSPLWLFGNTGNEPFKAPNTGLLYLWEAPFLGIGLLFFLFSRHISWQVKVLFLYWICADFVAPGLTTQAPHAMRAYTLLPLPQILTALGIIITLGFLQKQSKGISLGFIALLSIVALQYMYQFITNYFVVFPKSQSQSFQYALQNAFAYVNENKNKYQKVVISNKNNLYQSYMFYLFYTKYDPVSYQKQGGTTSGGFNETHTIGNISFQPISPSHAYPSKTLLVGNPGDLPPNSTQLVTSYYVDGTPGVIIESK